MSEDRLFDEGIRLAGFPMNAIDRWKTWRFAGGGGNTPLANHKRLMAFRLVFPLSRGDSLRRVERMRQGCVRRVGQSLH